MENALHLNLFERSSLYFISGFVEFKENLKDQETQKEHNTEDSEFTRLVPRGKLWYPPAQLYELSLCLYTYFKNVLERITVIG